MKHQDHTILVIEDDTDIRESIQQFLELEGFRVASAETGQEGLVYLESNPSPCLILLDLYMPVMNGKTFLEEIRKKEGHPNSKIPILAVTAVPPAGELAESVKPMVNAFLRKPIDLDQFLGLIKQYC